MSSQVDSVGAPQPRMQIIVCVNAVWSQTVSQSNSYKAKQLGAGSKAASGEAKQQAVRQNSEAKQQWFPADRFAVAMPLHRCL